MEEPSWIYNNGHYDLPLNGGVLRAGRNSKPTDTVYFIQYIPAGKKRGVVLRYSMARGEIESQLTDEEIMLLLETRGLFNSKQINHGITDCLKRRVFSRLEKMASIRKIAVSAGGAE